MSIWKLSYHSKKLIKDYGLFTHAVYSVAFQNSAEQAY